VIQDAQVANPSDKYYSYTSEEIDKILLTHDPEYNSLVFYKPLSDENFRMINQQGLFTVSRSPHTIEEWVLNNYSRIRDHLESKLDSETSQQKREGLRADLDSGWVLLKVNLETNNHDRVQILKVLNRMNINYATLFPDVEGASLYANMQGEIKHY